MFKKFSPFIVVLLIAGFFIGKYLYMKPKYINGEIAPAFTATTLDGSTLSLEDLKGNYVLLDFWGTWCGPCRQEIPDLKALHEKYHRKSFHDAKDFKIIGIALEKEGSEERWKKSIERLGLDWDYHIFDGVSSFKFLDAKIASNLYGVKEVPTKYLINEEGYIMGVNLPFEEMDALLAKRLK